AHIYSFENRRPIGNHFFDAETGNRATTGYTIQVAVDEQSRELCFVSPDILFERMGVKP
ncbi:acyl-CoA thioesterase, partial [Escherichia coli]|nr:acyl-CoA thioesterase [Escherichia coli]